MKLLLVLLLGASLYAQAPRIYASIADPIYKNFSSIASLSMLEVFANDKERISAYIQRTVEAKIAADAIAEEREGAMDKREYLKILRSLTKEYDYFMAKANRQFRHAMNRDDYETFAFLIKTGLIDIELFEQDILKYYTSGQKCMPIEEIDMFITYKEKGEERVLMRQQIRQQSYRQYKENRIERFRAQDRAEKAAYEKQLREEAEQTKAKVRAELKSELSR